MATKQLLRWSAAQMLGDLVIGVGSGTGGTSILIDTRRVEPDNNWRGYNFYIYEGLNGANHGVTVPNGGFETLAGGLFDSWVEYTTGGNIEVEATNKRSGSYAAKITMTVGGTAPYLTQNITVLPSTTYTISAWSRGNGALGRGQLRVLDNTDSSVLFNALGTLSATYQQITGTFTTPSTCTSVAIRLTIPTTPATYCYFDDVTLETDTAYTDNNVDFWTVAQSSAASTSLTLSAPLTYTSDDEKYELHAVPKEDYDRAMSIAFNEIKELALITTMAATIGTTAATLSAQEVDVSDLTTDGWTHVYKVEIDRGMGWEKLRPTKWTTLTGESLIRIAYDIYNTYQGYPLRLHGLKRPTEPDHDMKEYDLPREGHQYIIYRTASLIMPSTPDAFDAAQRSKLAGRWEQEAVRLRQALTTILPANVRRL